MVELVVPPESVTGLNVTPRPAGLVAVSWMSLAKPPLRDTVAEAWRVAPAAMVSVVGETDRVKAGGAVTVREIVAVRSVISEPAARTVMVDTPSVVLLAAEKAIVP
jgi:hypothetical protein